MEKRIKRVAIYFIVFILAISVISPVFAEKAAEPELTAKGAVLYCNNTGETILSKNGDEKMSPYSITKIMTVMLAAQKLPMDKKVTVSETAASEIEASLGLVAGEEVTVEDLMYGTMLQSGNDAAWALGEAVSGDMDSFVKLMNDTAKNIGCKNTNFTNPNGMKESEHYTTANDMLLIMKVAFDDDTVRKIAGTDVYNMPATNKNDARKIKTHIGMIKKKDSGVYAAKTGYWEDYDCSIALGYRKKGLSLYIVLIGDTKDERTNDVKKLVEYAEKKVEGIKIVDKDQASGKVRIKQGAKTRLKAYTAEAGYAYLPKEASESLISTKTVMKEDIKAPVKAGTVVGTYQIYAADELVNEIDLIIKEDVQKGWFTSYLGISNMMAMIIGTVLVIIIVMVIWVAVIKAKRRHARKVMRMQKAMEIAKMQLEKEEELKERGWRF